MRFQAVLYLAVLLCVVKLAAGACTNGLQLFDNGSCVCPSGYTGAACENLATGCDASKVTAAPTQADHFPVLDTVSPKFESNTLKFDLVGPFVQDRQYTGISWLKQNFTAGGERCSMGSDQTYWTASFTAGCHDLFHIEMPWNVHGSCGFWINHVEENSADDLINENNQTAIAEDHYVSYTAKFTLYYVDSLGQIEDFKLTRNTSVPYQIFVRFPTQLDVSLTNVNVSSIVDMGIALTGDSFDPDTQLLTMEITVINSWPNMLDIRAPQWADGIRVPEQVTWIPSMVLTSDMELCSDEVEGSYCKQSFQLTFNTSTCTYDGHYNFSALLFTCRGEYYTSCTSSFFQLEFDLTTSSVCSNITIEPPLTGNLVPFHGFDETAFTAGSVTPFINPATDGFNIGQWGYFQIQLSGAADAQKNDVYLKFFEVSFEAMGVAPQKFLVQGGNILSEDTDVSGAYHFDEAKFGFMDRVVGANDYTNLKAFKVYFSSVVFKVLPTSYTVYTFRASAYATFAGNEGETDQGQKKRVVDFVWEVTPDQMKAWTKVPLTESESSVKEVQTIPQSSNVAYIVGGGVAGLVAVAAAVFAVVKSKKTTYAPVAESRA